MKKVFETITDLLFYFICFCIVGWIYEVVLFLIDDHIFVNRGFFFGPWLPVYGFGGLIIYFLFNKLKKKPIKIWKLNIRPVLIYIYIVLSSTLVELIATYVMDLMKIDWIIHFKNTTIIIKYVVIALFIIDAIIHIFTGSTYVGP